MWWLLVPIIIGIVIAATIIDHMQEYSSDKIVRPHSRAAPGVGGPPIYGVYTGFEIILDGEKENSRSHFEAIADEMRKLDKVDERKK